MSRSEVITRRNLPHWYMPGAAHFVTYRLAGTIPVEVIRRLRAQRDAALRRKPDAGQNFVGHRERVHKQFFANYDKYLDQQRDIAWLAQPEIANIVRENESLPPSQHEVPPAGLLHHAEPRSRIVPTD